ncbi:RasL, unspecified Ras-like protein [Monocercomonoides exilis]|uniref:RasL, unspecified Ras-like protein n=1 Tax=Monocercomonoides exilis TaxID=2049356 RepID=UPI00355A1C62|nr:RasL, unspecified Ras-like protein [Monocercomonoides exilis]|eukprot:MONOS_873.1-p1 / transcript=MONOS_873.1 / gene=MONOS_873 / organism=Monocercomonoides_exilis_PA203 / gene_product=RasL, unspecified Ras-like protein / transcript_product=RasL, unspecified Ras-like protein / location=Mono_scaffold00014:157032-158968(-) / protein_length=393 / sequence_SO=supercontig / SO=protein_coding / is_pseudo=false
MVRIAIVGCTGVGKSSLILQLMGNTWEPTHFQTVLSEAYILNYVFGGETIRLEIEDTKGFDTTDRREPLVDEHSQSAELLDVVRQAYIVVYDMCDRRTFEECRDIMPRIQQNFMDFHIPVIGMVVANKSDVADRRVVSDDEGQRLAAQYGYKYTTTSARLNRGIKELFDHVIQLICSTFRPYTIKELEKFGSNQIPAVQRAGWIEKKGFFGFYRKRYAMLCGRVLFLYKSQSESSPSSVHPLRGAQITRETTSNAPCLRIEIKSRKNASAAPVAASSSSSSDGGVTVVSSSNAALATLPTYSVVLRFASFRDMVEWERELLATSYRSITFDFFIHLVPSNFGFPTPLSPPKGFCLKWKERHSTYPTLSSASSSTQPSPSVAPSDADETLRIW